MANFNIDSASVNAGVTWTFRKRETIDVDKDGNPLLWEFRHISSKENSLIQDEVMTSDSVKNKAADYLH